MVPCDWFLAEGAKLGLRPHSMFLFQACVFLVLLAAPLRWTGGLGGVRGRVGGEQPGVPGGHPAGGDHPGCWRCCGLVVGGRGAGAVVGGEGVVVEGGGGGTGVGGCLAVLGGGGALRGTGSLPQCWGGAVPPPPSGVLA